MVAKNLLTPGIFLGLLALLVAISAALGKPKQRFATIEFPPPIGVRIITWASLAAWVVLVLAPLALRIYWLAGLLTLGPLYTLYRWPETISIDELRIHSSAWCHRDVSILWNEIQSAGLGKAGDSLVLRSQTGDKIAISSLQVGADRLAAEITRRTGNPCPCPKWNVIV